MVGGQRIITMGPVDTREYIDVEYLMISVCDEYDRKGVLRVLFGSEIVWKREEKAKDIH